MKTFIYLITIGLLLSSCSDYEDSFESINKKPEIEFSMPNGDIFPEALIDSLKLENKTYEIGYKIVDDQQNLNIEYSADVATTTITQENEKLIVSVSELGNHKIEIKTKDGFGEASKYNVTIVTFDNLPPVAKMTLDSGKSMLSKFERRINASQSFDKDAKFGGKIVTYEFRVENQAFIRSTNDYMDYIFPQAGSYRISLRVQDHNGAWSEPITEQFPVN